MAIDTNSRTITITMTVSQFDMLRFAARRTAKEHRRKARTSKQPVHTDWHNGNAEELERLTSILSNAMRQELGEQDFYALDIGHANQPPATVNP